MKHCFPSPRSLPFRLLGTFLASWILLLPSAVGQIEFAEIDGYVEPLFPVSLSNRGILEGQIEILVEIGAEGQLRDWLTLRATHQAFVPAIANVIDQWTFVPGRIDGEPRSSARRYRFEFRRGTIVRTISALDMIDVQTQRSVDHSAFTYGLAPLSALDRLPVPIEIVRPRVDPRFLRQDAENAVEVTFYIDQTGHPRIPIITALEGDPILADSVDEALRQWRFEPPMVDGEPVVVQVRQPFRFSAEN